MLRTIEWPSGSPKFSVLSICYDPPEGPLNDPEPKEISLAKCRRHREGAPPRADRHTAAAPAVSRPRVKRWVWAAGGVVVLCSLLALGAARMAGRQGSRPAALISVVTGWLGAWVLWGFVGGLANHYGLARYDGTLFALLAVAGAVW